jgi:transposase, IS5 family
VLLPDGDKLWSTERRAIDEILDDDVLVDVVDAALRRRHPLSGRRGRLGTPAAVVLRMLVLKHLRDWSFDDCEREVRGSLVYRAFCRIDCERVPDAQTLIRLAHLLGPETLKPVLERVVQLARQRGVTRGQRLRVDTTVVETDIHYPTDSSLLADGVRVLTRTLKRLGAGARGAAIHIRDRTRSVRRRVFEIVQRTRAAGRGSARTPAQRKARVTMLYKEVMAITRTVVRHADTMLHDMPHARGRRSARLRDGLRQTVGLVRRVLDQTRARVIKGDTHHPDKIVPSENSCLSGQIKLRRIDGWRKIPAVLSQHTAAA